MTKPQKKMRDQTYKGLSLYERFDKFLIEPKFDVNNLDRMVEIVNEYIDEARIEDLVKNQRKLWDDRNIYLVKPKQFSSDIRKILKGEK